MGRKSRGRDSSSAGHGASKHSEIRIKPATQRQSSASTLAQREAEARRKFDRLARRWRRETAVLSSTVDIAMHPSYQAIIGMGELAVPLILDSLTRRFDHWFWALEAITQDNPVPRRLRGNIEAMARAWLKWGSDKGLVTLDAKAAAA